MGNTKSNVTSGVKKQTDAGSIQLYKFVDLKGGGLFVDMMKRASQTKQYAELDHAIRTKVEPFLYNRGKGKWIPISKIVLLRNKERPRHKMLPVLRAMEKPEDYDIDKDMEGMEEPDEATMDKSKYRLVCWSLGDRGAVGETILHLCLLNATAIHSDLAKRLLRFYPRLINDIYIDDEYYGENVLHIAIVNEDPSMVKFLLDSGADVNERCCGCFMSPEDQKESRNDSVDHEYVSVNPQTNYDGYVYWGEYPLSFAACLGQEECYRLILARGADPDKQDTNGNTVLHMLVILKNFDFFDMAYEVGSSLSVKNVQDMTPLTLAARLARKELFFHIMNIEREIYWQIGSITCAAYPLSLIDTIDVHTGKINEKSALNLVVFGETNEHLELMDGVLIDLLQYKWNTFVKSRPGPIMTADTASTEFPLNETTSESYPSSSIDPSDVTLSTLLAESLAEHLTINFKTSNITSDSLRKITLEVVSNVSSSLRDIWNLTTDQVNSSGVINDSAYANDFDNSLPASSDTVYNPTILELNTSMLTSRKDSSKDKWWDDLTGECRLMDMTNPWAQIRLTFEIVMVFGAIYYIITALKEARFLGYKMFKESLQTTPSRCTFLASCCILLSFPFLRIKCHDKAEDMLAVVVMITTAPYFLFFCRGFKTVGPFAIMIYRMLQGDLVRFVSIYLVFVMGFSQAYYIIFLSFDNPSTPEGVDDSKANPMPSPMESVMAMFLMSMTNFGDYYEAFENTEHEMEAKLMFVVYMAIVAILLVNMLIAMMGNTYTKIAETRNEWQRQWARIVLVVERGVAPEERLKKLNMYSQPMSDGRLALVLQLHQTEEDKEEMKEILEMKRVHERLVKKRKERIQKEQEMAEKAKEEAGKTKRVAGDEKSQQIGFDKFIQ